MRIPAISTAALALLAAASPAAAQEVRGILFVAQVTPQGYAVLEPVANLLDGGFAQPAVDPDASDFDPFKARWLAAGKRYEVLARGERIGTMTITGQPQISGCSGLTVSGGLDGRLTPPEELDGLAGEGLPEQRDAPWLREATAAEKRDLDRMAAALFQAHGTEMPPGTHGDTALAALIGHPNARPALVGSYLLQMSEAPLRRAAVLIIAEDTQAGYRPAHVWFHQATDADVELQELVDAADLDGDGQPELVVRHAFYESWSYTILSRTEEGWVEVYNGGGGGC